MTGFRSSVPPVSGWASPGWLSLSFALGPDPLPYWWVFSGCLSGSTALGFPYGAVPLAYSGVVFAYRRDPERPGGVGLAFTDRLDGVSGGAFGSLNLAGSGGDEPQNLRANVGLVSTTLGIASLTGVHQVHGRDVLAVGPDGAATRLWQSDDDLPDADALVTTAPGVGLCIRVADCVPVLLADERAGVIGAAHAGRKGLLAGVLEAVVAAMRQRGAADIAAWIGPHICGACYEVPPEMAEDAWARLPATRSVSRHGTTAIDIGAGVASELGRLGCRVHRQERCTAEEPSLFSYRRDGGVTGRQAGIVWLAPTSGAEKPSR